MHSDQDKRERDEVNPHRKADRQATDDWGKFNKGRERKMWEQTIEDASGDAKEGEMTLKPKHLARS